MTPSGAQTAGLVRSIQSGHDGLYVQRARGAFPLLVQLADAEQTATYGTFARLMSMPNARNLNYVLGSVGVSLDELRGDGWDRIPPLQAIVVNKGTGYPGEGFDQFLKRWFQLQQISKSARPALLRGLQQEVFAFGRWAAVLRQLGLQPLSPLATRAPVMPEVSQPHGGSGESPEHRAFKRWLAAQPHLFGLSAEVRGEEEADLDSGDTIDVLYRTERRTVGVEAKSRVSAEGDLLRGVFQCVKYAAVLRAMALWKGERGRCAVYLALEASATPLVRETAGILGVALLENARGASTRVSGLTSP